MQPFDKLKRAQTQKGELKDPEGKPHASDAAAGAAAQQDVDTDNSSEDSEDESIDSGTEMNTEQSTRKAIIAKMVGRKWTRLALDTTGLKSDGDNRGPEFTPSWCRGIAPQLEGRIKTVDT